MQPIIKNSIEIKQEANLVFLVKEISLLKDFGFTETEIDYIEGKVSKKKNLIHLNRLEQQVFVRFSKDTGNDENEKIRKDGNLILKELKKEDVSEVSVVDLIGCKNRTIALVEGIALSAYAFDRYKSKKDDVVDFELKEIFVSSPAVDGCEINELNNIIESVYITRNLVNEPVDKLNAVQLGEFIVEQSKKDGFHAEVFNKNKIEALKFGGLLAVNKGSIDPPTFSIMEWKPENAVNEKPYILVGKGVVFDTGGINLKTPPGSLDTMKCDMGGAASVVGTITAIAKNKLPIYVIGLVPATDNRPGKNAFVPGDILEMHNGLTVEVLNTDAEGRLILADALSYANKYEPELVIDLATLTGSAVMAIGEYGTVAMGTASDEVFGELEKHGYVTHERVVKFPFWSDYDALIESDIADIKNLGGREGGSITAGKFLSKFVEYPWIHLDIAGPAFHLKESSYRGKGASGVGVRLLYHFFKSIVSDKQA
ncbi:leucyl aminopeptidase family protein [Plebeiibacterium sediminum]|uniref:Leucyl aminopeptidase n=1 Tax=Plebeiibacterium sediminum TaxID=2992112 RepID=A0AAE3M3D2_9BACT|nr:leucyl aminopeptidase [Plebeiobacterium sediminum]MCW3786338.1 leucyl aminopeptidase [Plebeiobacterium sediminum]